METSSRVATLNMSTGLVGPCYVCGAFRKARETDTWYYFDGKMMCAHHAGAGAGYNVAMEAAAEVFREVQERAFDRCVREWDEPGEGFEPGWQCLNDHTACAWNDGHNTCTHPGDSLAPLE